MYLWLLINCFCLLVSINKTQLGCNYSALRGVYVLSLFVGSTIVMDPMPHGRNVQINHYVFFLCFMTDFSIWFIALTGSESSVRQLCFPKASWYHIRDGCRTLKVLHDTHGFLHRCSNCNRARPFSLVSVYVKAFAPLIHKPGANSLTARALSAMGIWTLITCK